MCVARMFAGAFCCVSGWARVAFRACVQRNERVRVCARVVLLYACASVCLRAVLDFVCVRWWALEKQASRAFPGNDPVAQIAHKGGPGQRPGQPFSRMLGAICMF
eukprot:2368144-Alexandrium_andersonii.AAC.1